MTGQCILSFTLSGHGLSGVVCLDGLITVATSLERLTRVKNDILIPITRDDLDTFGWSGDPAGYQAHLDLPFDLARGRGVVDFREFEGFDRLVTYLLEAAGVGILDVDCVVFTYRHVESARRYFLSRNPRIEFVVPEHHYGHACQAFLSSPFDEAAIMVVDGQGVPMARTGGDQLSGCLAHGRGTAIETLWEFPVRHSLGGMYAAFTRAVGFATNEEGKTMGLAPYGGPRFYDELKADLKFGGRDFGLRQLVRRGFRPESVLYRLPGYARFLDQFTPRRREEPITDVHRDLAFAAQELTEDVMVAMADWLHAQTKSDNLCIAGGVGLNCVANYQVLTRSNFKRIFIHPNAGDNGLAVGHALQVYHQRLANDRRYVATTDSLGRAYSESDVRSAIAMHAGTSTIDVEEFVDLSQMYERMAVEIADGRITSWFQGRSEFGPRALGNRGIIADPRRADMKDILNSRVKFRESFRPFTPSVLAERAADYFALDQDSPFMLLAAYVRPGRSVEVPAITHADNTARVQTVTRDVNERYYDLIAAFDRLTGVPLVLETSFNIAGEPIVESPEDAVRCFLSTDIDILCIDRFILSKPGRSTRAGRG